MSDDDASKAHDAEAVLVRVRALLVDPTRHQGCLCGESAMIRPEDLADALKGPR